MSTLKTTPHDGSISAFLDGLADEKQRQDAYQILALMEEATGQPPKMWGPSIIGFGNYHYKYASGREGDWFLAGFSPRKQNLTLYIMAGFEHYDSLMAQLGKYKTGKSCLYIKKLEDVNQEVLRMLIKESVQYMAERYG